MENKYKDDQLVVATAHPDTILVVRRYVDRIYYCRIKGSESEKDLVYFERELEPYNNNNND